MSESGDVFGNVECPVEGCGQTFIKKKELHSHLVFVHQKVEPECPICHERFSTERRLRIHEKTHGDFQCPICGQKFNEKQYLKTHVLIHENQREKFKCSMCNKTFLHKGNLRVHFKNKHENNKYPCFICDKNLCSSQKLNEHLEKKHKVSHSNIEISLKELEEISSDEEEKDSDQNSISDSEVKSSFQFQYTDNSFTFPTEDLELLLEDAYYN